MSFHFVFHLIIFSGPDSSFWMSILLIFTVYRLCPVNLNSQTNWFYSLFLRIPGIPLIFFMICSFISARWEWAEVELRGDMEPCLLWQNVSYRLEFHILLFLSMSSLPPVLCFASCTAEQHRSWHRAGCWISHFSHPTSHCNAITVCRYTIPAHELPANDFPIIAQTNLWK